MPAIYIANFPGGMMARKGNGSRTPVQGYICIHGQEHDTSKGPGRSMSQAVGLHNNSYKPITNTAWVRLCKLQKGCTRLAAASDKVTSWLPMVGGSLQLLPLKLVAMM